MSSRPSAFINDAPSILRLQTNVFFVRGLSQTLFGHSMLTTSLRTRHATVAFWLPLFHFSNQFLFSHAAESGTAFSTPAALSPTSPTSFLLFSLFLCYFFSLIPSFCAFSFFQLVRPPRGGWFKCGAVTHHINLSAFLSINLESQNVKAFFWIEPMIH